MKLDEITISKAIIESYNRKLLNALELDVAIAGAGPSGLLCAYYLAKKKKRVAIFEKHMAPGGGIWGGGIMYNEIVFQEKSKSILDELGIRTRKYEKNYYLADSLEVASVLVAEVLRAGAVIFNLISVEDVMIRRNRICGFVLNWTAAEESHLHVDPITVRAEYVVDATGHPAEIAKIAEKKSGMRLKTKTGTLIGERSMWSEVGEDIVVKNTREAAPGLYACGLAANTIFGGSRMGPIFGGMLLSGKKLAEDLLKKL